MGAWGFRRDVVLYGDCAGMCVTRMSPLARFVPSLDHDDLIQLNRRTYNPPIALFNDTAIQALSGAPDFIKTLFDLRRRPVYCFVPHTTSVYNAYAEISVDATRANSFDEIRCRRGLDLTCSPCDLFMLEKILDKTNFTRYYLRVTNEEEFDEAFDLVGNIPVETWRIQFAFPSLSGRSVFKGMLNEEEE